MKRTFFFTAIIILLQGLAMAQGLEFSIRFQDKRIYFPGKSVPVKVTLVNESPEPYRFKLADDKMFSIAFDVRDQANRSLEAQDIFIRKQTRNQPVFFRELSLQPGEEYSFTEDLSEYVLLDQPGLYSLSCRLYPELARFPAAGLPLESNRLILSLRPEAGVESVQSRISEATGEALKAERLPPDEVVRRTIVARQQGRWNEFFLYLDLEEMIRRDPSRRQAWARESEDGRIKMLERYRADLSQAVVDADIVTIPQSFEILQTSYGSSTGQVRVLERFQYPSYVERREYSYYLRRTDDVWYIYDYTVSGKGTE